MFDVVCAFDINFNSFLNNHIFFIFAILDRWRTIKVYLLHIWLIFHVLSLATWVRREWYFVRGDTGLCLINVVVALFEHFFIPIGLVVVVFHLVDLRHFHLNLITWHKAGRVVLHCYCTLILISTHNISHIAIPNNRLRRFSGLNLLLWLGLP